MSAMPKPEIFLQLCLYLSGPAHPANPALASMEELRRLGYVFNLEVIDITNDPQRAETDRVIATPTLARMQPEPVRRVMGDLANVPRLLQLLQIS